MRHGRLAAPQAVGRTASAIARAPARAGAIHAGAQGEVQREAGSVARVAAAPGAPLPAAARAYFEPRFGRSFADVRVHTGDRAAAAAAGMRARAFTLGSDIGFAAGRFAPESAAGRRLLAHELAHVLQGGDVVRRQPEHEPPAAQAEEGPAADPDKEPAADPAKEGDPPRHALARELLGYPAIVDLWNDIFAQNLSPEHKKAFERKGTEGMSLWNLQFGGALTMQAPFDTVGGFLSAWATYAKTAHEVAGGGNFYLDLFSSFTDISIDRYLRSPLFASRMKTHLPGLISMGVVGQGIFSTVQALKAPSAEVGELEPTQWEKQTQIVKPLLSVALADMIKAPDFFSLSPLKLPTHPVYAASSATAGDAPSSLVFEHQQGMGEGQGGQKLKFGATANLAQIAAKFQKGASSAEDLADLQKNRRGQGSFWFNYDRSDPTQLQQQAGKLPGGAIDGGTFFGGGGYFGQLQAGARYGGEAGRQLTAWFARGGFGYSGEQGAALQKIGFVATYTDWKEQDILAPKTGPGGAGVAGQATQVEPFGKVQFGERNRFSAGAALGFASGSQESLGLSSIRGDFSYTYLGDAPGGLPAFKLDLSGSASRLDWWNPDSPLIMGVMARANVGQLFVAGQVNWGADKIPEQRLSLFGDRNEMPTPTAVIFTAGFRF
jgi:hypothetical protein